MPRRSGQRKPPAQKKPPLTHFLCLPLVTAASKPQLEASIRSFRADVTSDESKKAILSSATSDGALSSSTGAITQIHPKAIRPVGALHCTLGVMSLTQEQLTKAIELLENTDVEQLLTDALSRSEVSTNTKQTPIEANNEPSQPASLNRPISPPAKQDRAASAQAQPIKIDLRGLISMHSPQSTSILYTAPQDLSDRLYGFCLALQDRFKEQSLLVPDDRKLKPHATLVNTIYAKGKNKPAQRRGQVQNAGANSAGNASVGDRSEGHGPNANAPLKIDARALLEKYKDFVWAENVVLDRIAICEMGAKKKFDGEGNVIAEEYTEVASVPLPQ